MTTIALAIDPNYIILVVIAVVNAGTAVLTWRTHNSIGDVNAQVGKVHAQVANVEKQTNGLTAQLVEVVGTAKFAEGVKSAEDKAAIVTAAVAASKLDNP